MMPANLICLAHGQRQNDRGMSYCDATFEALNWIVRQPTTSQWQFWACESPRLAKCSCQHSQVLTDVLIIIKQQLHFREYTLFYHFTHLWQHLRRPSLLRLFVLHFGKFQLHIIHQFLKPDVLPLLLKLLSSSTLPLLHCSIRLAHLCLRLQHALFTPVPFC